MRFGSLFSGIEAASLAWNPLGWECAWVAEIEPFPCAVLAHHYPSVPNLGNVKEITEAQIQALGHVDVVVFGFPCQDLSVAGKRAGLKGERSGLFFDAMRIVRWSGARWAVAENVPGLFSTHGGRDFAAVVGEMAGCEFGVPSDGWETCGAAVGPDGLVEWGVLDAQFFGLAQRRKRVFLVRDTGNWAGRPPVLLESASLRGDPAPRRETREGTAGRAARSVAIRGRDGTPQAELGDEVANAVLTPNGDRGGIGIGAILTGVDFQNCADTGDLCGTLQGEALKKGGEAGLGVLCLSSGQANAEIVRDGSPSLTCLHEAPIVAFSCKDSGHDAGELADPIAANQARTYTREGSENFRLSNVAHSSAMVRRLTPREYERLQGFPDDYTLVPYRNKSAADGPRYKALGNSMAVPVMQWIGRRIDLVEALAADDELRGAA